MEHKTDALHNVLEAEVLPRVAGLNNEELHHILIGGFKKFDSDPTVNTLKDLILLMGVIALKTRELDETMDFTFEYHRRSNPLVREWVGGPEKDLQNVQELVKHYKTYGVRYLQEEVP